MLEKAAGWAGASAEMHAAAAVSGGFDGDGGLGVVEAGSDVARMMRMTRMWQRGLRRGGLAK